MGHKSYWNYFDTLGYRESAASFEAISENLFLVIGMHSVNPKQHIDIDTSSQKLQTWLSEAKDYLIDTSVKQSLWNIKDSGFPQSEADARAKLFTNREFQVLRELWKGLSNKEIAYAQSLSESAVQNHLKRMYRKLNVHNRTEFLAKVNTTTHQK